MTLFALTRTAEGSKTALTLFVAGQGLYSFKGTAYRRSGVFERIQLVQGEILRLLKFRGGMAEIAAHAGSGLKLALERIAGVVAKTPVATA